jgi:hypothetical protein
LAIRAALQTPIDQIAADDPRRVAFDSLHGYSVALMGVAIVAALVAFFIIGTQSREGRRRYLSR